VAIESLKVSETAKGALDMSADEADDVYIDWRSCGWTDTFGEREKVKLCT
jgi:hypothetical protein